MKRFFSLVLITAILLSSLVFPISAVDDSLEDVYVFVEHLASNETGFSLWENADLIKAYDLFDLNGVSKCATLYYVGNKSKGYLIVDQNGTVLEFANGISAYDNCASDFSKAIYDNGCYYVEMNGICVRLFSDGSVEATSTPVGRAILNMDAFLQGGNLCIPTAIAHIMWYWDSNGYSSLTGSNFQTVIDEIDEIMGSNNKSNSACPSAIAVYAFDKGYSGSGAILTASYSTMVSEINAGRPCLLGFSSSNSYYTSAHMTACCGYYEYSGTKYSVVADGTTNYWSYKIWGSYNDFICRVNISY